MPRLYILAKRKGSKQWLGAVPIKDGVTPTQAKSRIKGRMKKGWVYKIVNKATLVKVAKSILKARSKRQLQKRPIGKKVQKRGIMPKFRKKK